MSSFSLNNSRTSCCSLNNFQVSKQYFKNKSTRRFQDLCLSKKYLFKSWQFLLNALNCSIFVQYIYIFFIKFFRRAYNFNAAQENYLLFARIPDSLHRWSSPMFAACRDSYIDTFNLCYIAFYYPTVYLAEVIVRNL